MAVYSKYLAFTLCCWQNPCSKWSAGVVMTKFRYRIYTTPALERLNYHLLYHHHHMMTSSNIIILPRYWSPVNAPHKGHWRGAVMFSLICAEQTIEQTIETPVIWDAIALIITSLHCQYTCWYILTWIPRIPNFLWEIFLSTCHKRDHLLRAWRHPIFTSTNVDFSSVRFSGTHLSATLQRVPKVLSCI